MPNLANYSPVCKLSGTVILIGVSIRSGAKLGQTQPVLNTSVLSSKSASSPNQHPALLAQSSTARSWRWRTREEDSRRPFREMESVPIAHWNFSLADSPTNPV